MDTSRNVVKRHQFADYLNTQTADKPNYCLMGVGFTSLNEEPGAQTESKKQTLRRFPDCGKRPPASAHPASARRSAQNSSRLFRWKGFPISSCVSLSALLSAARCGCGGCAPRRCSPSTAADRTASASGRPQAAPAAYPSSSRLWKNR